MRFRSFFICVICAEFKFISDRSLCFFSLFILFLDFVQVIIDLWVAVDFIVVL